MHSERLLADQNLISYLSASWLYKNRSSLQLSSKEFLNWTHLMWTIWSLHNQLLLLFSKPSKMKSSTITLEVNLILPHHQVSFPPKCLEYYLQTMQLGTRSKPLSEPLSFMILVVQSLLLNCHSHSNCLSTLLLFLFDVKIKEVLKVLIL